MKPLEMANPLNLAKGAFGLAGTAVGLAGAVARDAAHVPVNVTKGALGLAGTAVGLAGTVARDTAHVLLSGMRDLGQEGEQATDVEAAPPGPTVAPVEPHAPSEPPIDVVGQALAAERGEAGDGAGMAHEPRAASRDEEHGDAASLHRAELDEIAEEAAAALEGDIEPEQHLTEPLLDPADAKAIAAELQMMSKAADPHKG